jgi:hypothetical protein
VIVLLFALAAASAGAAAEDAISVTAYREPVDKSYRKMVRGLDAFEEKRHLAPQASLRFKVLQRKPHARLDGIELEIAGDSFSLPVDLAPDRSFTLERSRQALREDAAVRAGNRKALSMTWRAEVRTPGVPPGTRRLGDLRLECEVGMAAGLVSNSPSPLARLFDALFDPPDYCNSRDNRYLFFAERPVFGVTLTSGGRSEAIPAHRLYGGASERPDWRKTLPFCDCEALLDRAFFLPLGDASWPDDTVVAFEYMDDPGPGIALGSTREEIAALIGRPRPIVFDSGYEVWAYRDTQPELVVLFAPPGLATKTRIRVESARQ